MDDPGPRQVLARRLRALREERWPGRKVNQAQLAAALGGAGKPVSVPLISSWESRTNPKVPPVSRIQDIARFYASPRSFDGKVGRLLSLDELTAPERAAWEGLLQELTRLRSEALDAPGTAPDPATVPDITQEIARSFSAEPYRFRPGDRITIVCGQVPDDKLRRDALHRPPGPRLHSVVPVFGP